MSRNLSYGPSMGQLQFPDLTQRENVVKWVVVPSGTVLALVAMRNLFGRRRKRKNGNGRRNGNG